MRGEASTAQIVWRACLVAVVLVAVGVTALFPRSLLQLVLPDQTVYADGFSEERFRKVRPGMSEQEVLSILGRPLEVYENAGGRKYRTSWSAKPSAVNPVDFRWWSYSKAGRLYDSYHVRAVRFDRDGRVVDVDQTFYND
jgi:outer membrane protein assembly factor BamE (lipoprotein component of BamABCDE complex)